MRPRSHTEISAQKTLARGWLVMLPAVAARNERVSVQIMYFAILPDPSIRYKTIRHPPPSSVRNFVRQGGSRLASTHSDQCLDALLSTLHGQIHSFSDCSTFFSFTYLDARCLTRAPSPSPSPPRLPRKRRGVLFPPSGKSTRRPGRRARTSTTSRCCKSTSLKGLLICRHLIFVSLHAALDAGDAAS